MNKNVNHEDGSVISESLSNQAKSQFVETVYIPIYEHTLLQPIYQNDNDVSSYLPALGKEIKGDIVVSELKPRSSPISSSKELKNKMVTLLNSMNISELLNICSSNLTNFTVEHHKTKVKDGYLSGMKIHRLNKNSQMIDPNLQKNLEKLYKMYVLDYISESFHKLKERVSHNYAEQITRTHFLNLGNNFATTNRQDLKKAVYILELEISKESKIELGDKICNRFASKGVTSLILPDELRPYTKQTGHYIDLINNPFGVYSRMNFSQIIEGIVSKNVFESDNAIKNDPSKSPEIIKWLNENIIKEFNYDEYFDQVSNLQKEIESNSESRERFNKHVIDNNLFIEGPNFSEINIKNLLKNSRIPINEEVIIKKKCLKYLKQKIKMNHLSVPVEDVTLKNIFVAPIYTLRLNKLTSSIISARGLGPCKFVTGQPLKGKASGGGSRVGYTAHYKSSEFGEHLDQIIPSQGHFMSRCNDYPERE